MQSIHLIVSALLSLWLDNDIQNSGLCINGYDVVGLDRNRHGGGVLLYVNSVLTHSIVYSGSTELELVMFLSCNLTVWPH